jgi:hypothetical protein
MLDWQATDSLRRENRSRTLRIVAVTSLVFGLVHFVLIALPVCLTGGISEGSLLLVAYGDWPYVWLANRCDPGWYLNHNSGIAHVVIGATIFWAAIGALLAWIYRLFRQM